ncbi:hypothetical protein BC830DRAFT_803418 [Chytriomyces sp. MP71]|nr:hypothetical protein BC830DRAFT_803418 [Chytriomyces sp. MP71]
MYQDTHAQSATVATSAHFKILRYDARMRDAVRKLTQLLLVDADAANEADAWEQEKTRSFVQQRIEHSVCEYVLQEKRRQVETRAAMRHAKTQSLLSSNARGGIQRLSNSMKGTRGRDHGAADRPPPPPSPTTVGVQTAANLVEGTKSQEKSDANASSPGLSPSTRHKPDLKIDTSVKKPEAPKSGVMQWMYDGLTTPITNVGSIFSATARPPSAISASIESSAGPCMETIFGVLDMPDSFIVPTGLEDWFVKPVMAHASSLNAIICATGQVESADEFVDAWQFLPAFAPFSDIFALGFNTESRVKMSQEMSSFVSRTNELHAASGLRPAPVATFAAGLESLREESPEDIAAAEVAGKELGQHVLNQSYGKRPVSLVGNGLGANVMYYALLEILTSIESGNNEEAFSLIDSVYLIGAPIPLDLSVWPKLSTLVNGRLVNAYSSQENYMSFLRDLDMDAEATDAAPFIAFTPITHADAFPRTKVENTDLHSLLRHETKISGGTLPRIMERVGFERAFADTTHLIITNDAGASYLPERRRSRQASLRPPPARDNPPAAFETETLFDAERELLDMLDTFKAANIAAFIQTRPGISGQLSSAIAFEPAALILEPLSRPGSNRTLDEDEADREQASGWVGVGLEPLGAE